LDAFRDIHRYTVIGVNLFSRMTAFPCQFSIFPATEFHAFGQQVLPNGQLGAVGCILLDEEATSIDRMQVCVFGPAAIGFQIRADILVRIPEATGVFLQAAAAGPEASPAANRAASDWFDLFDLLQRKVLVTADQNGQYIPAENFR